MRRVLCAILCLLCVGIVPARAESEAKYVAITFDDGPSGRFTRRLLDGLLEEDVKATFFLCGYRMERGQAEVTRILREGHEVGCHGYSHKSMRLMSRRDMAQEIMDTEALLPEGYRVSFLRPPGGCCSDIVEQVASVRKLAILTWSVDPRDWATDDKLAVERAVMEQVKDGDVILLHDMTDNSVDAALDIVRQLKAQGFRFVTASELAAMRGYSLRPGKNYCSFPRKGLGAGGPLK